MRILQPLRARGIMYRSTAAVMAALMAACCICGPASASASMAVSAADDAAKATDAAANFADRKSLYDQVSTVTQIPWHRLAAIDQYERTLTRVHPKDRKHPDRTLGIFIPSTRWAGPLNPNQEDVNPTSISVFSGIGLDGDGDGKADPNNDIDLLYTVATRLSLMGMPLMISASAYGHTTRTRGPYSASCSMPNCTRPSGSWTCSTMRFPFPSRATIPTEAPLAWGATGEVKGFTRERICLLHTESPFEAPVTASSKLKAGINTAAGASASVT